jgi:hypothetical protein
MDWLQFSILPSFSGSLCTIKSSISAGIVIPVPRWH